MQQKTLTKLLSAAGIIGLTAALAACGGGGGSTTASNDNSTSSNNPAPSQMGMVNVGMTDGPSDAFSHVWVTVKAISFHTSADAVWNASDATWKTFTLPAPVTLDLAQLNNGALNQVFANLQLPAGSYKQIRFFFAGADDTLAASALAIKDNEATPAALQWNDQVEYTDATTGTISEAPLEIAAPKQGIQLNGDFNVTAGGTLSLAVDFDLNRIIVPFMHDGMEAFTMRPNLRYFDLTQSGAISGQIDASKICQSAATASCAHHLIVHAEVLSADGSRHVTLRSTSVDAATGKFTLYPVALKDDKGNALSYDLVIRGRNMETMLVTGVTPAGNATGGATQVQSTPLEPTVTASEYGAQFASALNPLTSGYAIFQQTLPASGTSASAPYEIRWNNTDPFSGKFRVPFMLENAPLHVAAFNGGSALTFNTVTPVEGAGGYNVATNEVAYYNLSSNLAIQAPAVGSTATFAPPSPTLISSVQSGTVSGNLAISDASSYDHATLVISRFASIITTQDVSALLATSGGAYTVTNLPAGSATTPQPGAYYYGYLRLWKAGAHKAAKIVPINGIIDLRNTNAVTGFNVSVSASASASAG